MILNKFALDIKTCLSKQVIFKIYWVFGADDKDKFTTKWYSWWLVKIGK